MFFGNCRGYRHLCCCRDDNFSQFNFLYCVMAIVADWLGDEQQKTPVCTAAGGALPFTFSAKRFVCYCGYGSLVDKKSRLFICYHSVSHCFEMAGPVNFFWLWFSSYPQ